MDTLFVLMMIVQMMLAAMDSGIANAVIMLSLPARIFHKIRRIPLRKSEGRDDLDIVTCSIFWVLYVKDHPDQFLVIRVMQIWYFVTFIFFTRDCISVMENRFKHRVIVVAEWLSVCFLLRLAFTLGAPMNFAFTVWTTGTILISLMKVLCEPSRPPYFWNEAQLFVKGVMWIIFGPSNMFILIPNLIGGLVGLVLLVYRRNWELNQNFWLFQGFL